MNKKTYQSLKSHTIAILVVIITLSIVFLIMSPVKSICDDVVEFCKGKEGSYNFTPYMNPNYDNYIVNCSNLKICQSVII